MKKKIFLKHKKIFTFAAICIFAIGVKAQTGGNLFGLELDKGEFNDNYIPNAEIQLSKENMTDNDIMQYAEEFAQTEAVYNSDSLAKQDDILEYLAFVKVFNISDENLKAVNYVITNGTTLQSAICAYKFWLTCNDDISLFKKICALEYKFYNEYWAEDAYNEITDNKKGVLSVDDVGQYLDKGISLDEINIANILSRKYDGTIYDILDRIENGGDIVDIMNDVYNTNLFDEKYSIPELCEMLKSYYETDMDYIVANDIVKDGKDDIISKIRAYKSSVYSSAYKTIEKSNLLNQLETTANISQSDISPNALDDTDEEELYNMTLENGMGDKCIRFLLKKGFTQQEIYQTSCHTTDDTLVFEKIREIRGIAQ